jgi:hypothetical protein
VLLRIPDREDAAGLGKTSFLLYTSNSLFKDRRNLGRGSFGIGSIASNLL